MYVLFVPFFQILGSKKEAAESEASTSGQSTARSEKATQQLAKLTLDDKAKHQQGGPSTSGQAQQQKQSQGGQQGFARGQGQQKQQQPSQGAGPSTSGQAQQQKQSQGGQQGAARGQGQQRQQQPPQGQSQQQKSSQGGQQGSARGQGQQKQQQPPKSGPPAWGQAQQQQQQQQKPTQGAPPPAADSAWGRSKPQGQGPPQQQPQATAWTQRPIQPSTQAAGSSGQKQQQQQQRPAQGARSNQGKGDQKLQTPKPAIIPYDYKICEYKGPGTRGRRVQIETNYLKLDVTNLVDCAYHYDVTIDFEPAGRSPPGKKFMHPVFAAFVAKNFPKASLAYDGQKNAYAPHQLDLTKPYERVVTIVDGETAQQRNFKVEIQEVRGSLIDLKVLRK